VASNTGIAAAAPTSLLRTSYSCSYIIALTSGSKRGTSEMLVQQPASSSPTCLLHLNKWFFKQVAGLLLGFGNLFWFGFQMWISKVCT